MGNEAVTAQLSDVQKEAHQEETKQNTIIDTIIDIDTIKKPIPHDKMVEEMLKDLYYIYKDNSIIGPHDQKQILKLYISSEIEGEIWIKRADDMDEWCRVQLPSKKQKEEKDADNTEFGKKFPKFHNYLMPKIRSKKMQQIETPFDVPKNAKSKLSIGNQLVRWMGIILFWAAALFVGLHVLVTFCFFSCCAVPICYASEKMGKYEDSLFLFSIGLLCSGLVETPFMVVYRVLLGGVDADVWDGEIQSWMIAYIAWGVCSYLATVIKIVFQQQWILTAELWILGLDLGTISPRKIRGTNSTIGIFMLLLLPSIAALLPSAIIGFIANFVLEEKFELKCNDSITGAGTNLCSLDGSGCCEVVSSHELSNSYTFIGGLASNILATWAVIRVCAYLLVKAWPEASVFAKRTK